MTSFSQMLDDFLHWVTGVQRMCVNTVRLCVLVSLWKQVVFFSHSRKLFKQRAFSVNLSISAATPVTAEWRASSEVGKYRINTRTLSVSVAWRVQWEVTRVPVYVNELSLREHRWSCSARTEKMQRLQKLCGGFTVQLKRELDNTENWPEATACKHFYLT